MSAVWFGQRQTVPGAAMVIDAINDPIRPWGEGCPTIIRPNTVGLERDYKIPAVVLQCSDSGPDAGQVGDVASSADRELPSRKRFTHDLVIAHWSIGPERTGNTPDST